MHAVFSLRVSRRLNGSHVQLQWSTASSASLLSPAPSRLSFISPFRSYVVWPRSFLSFQSKCCSKEDTLRCLDRLPFRELSFSQLQLSHHWRWSRAVSSQTLQLPHLSFDTLFKQQSGTFSESKSSSTGPSVVSSHVQSSVSATGSSDQSTPAAAKQRSRLRERTQPIFLTAEAAARIKTLVSQRPNAKGVRLSVRARGCSGQSYTMNYVEEPQKNDEVVTQFGATVFVDPKALFYVLGTTIDFRDDEIASEFVFHNPKKKGECGCGESFNV